MPLARESESELQDKLAFKDEQLKQLKEVVQKEVSEAQAQAQANMQEKFVELHEQLQRVQASSTVQI